MSYFHHSFLSCMASLKTNRLYNNGTCEKQQIVGTGKDKIGLALKEKKKALSPERVASGQSGMRNSYSPGVFYHCHYLSCLIKSFSWGLSLFNLVQNLSKEKGLLFLVFGGFFFCFCCKQPKAIIYCCSCRRLPYQFSQTWGLVKNVKNLWKAETNSRSRACGGSKSLTSNWPLVSVQAEMLTARA